MGRNSQDPRYHGKKASRQSSGPFCSSGVSRACLTNPHKCPWRPPRQVLSITQIPSPTEGRAPVRNFLRARSGRGLNRAPLANQNKAVAAAPTMRAGIHHRSLGVFKATILDANFASVRTYYRQSDPQLRSHRIVGQNNNVLQLRARPQASGRSSLFAARGSTNEKHLEHRELLRPRAKGYHAAIANPNRVEIRDSPNRVLKCFDVPRIVPVDLHAQTLCQGRKECCRPPRVW